MLFGLVVCEVYDFDWEDDWVWEFYGKYFGG